MTKSKIFNALFSGGNITLPYLIAITCPNLEPIYLVNNNEDINYDGNIYKASTFDYTPPNNKGDGGTLDITGGDNDLIYFIDAANDKAKLEVVGVLIDNSDVQVIHTYKHYYGNITINSQNSITWNLSKDNRLEMVFNPYTYDTDLNRGNA